MEEEGREGWVSGNCRKKGLDKGREGKEEPNLGTGRGEVDECGEVEITKKRLDKEEKNPKTYIDFLVRHVARQRNGRVYRARRRVRIGGGNSCPSAPLVIWLERESAGVAGRHGSGRLIRGSGDGVIALLLRSSKAKARTNPAEAAGEGVHHVRRGWKTGKAGKAPRVFQDQTQGTGLLAAFDGDGGGEGGLGVRTRHYSVYKAVFRGMEEVAAGGFNLGFVIRHRELPPTDTRPDALTHTTTTHIHEQDLLPGPAPGVFCLPVKRSSHPPPALCPSVLLLRGAGLGSTYFTQARSPHPPATPGRRQATPAILSRVLVCPPRIAVASI